MRKYLSRIISAIAAITMIFGFTPLVFAASITSISDTMTTIKSSTPASHSIKFTTPTGVTTASGTITVNFPSFTGSPIFSNITMSHGATGTETVETIVTAATATNWGAAYSANTLTLTHPTGAGTADVTAGQKVIIGVNGNTLTNPVQGTYVLTINTSTGDTGKFAIATNDNGQILVSTSVDPSITFTVSSPTAAIPTLTTGAVGSASATYNVTTNSASGYTVTVKDANSGLLGSGGNTINSSATTLSAGTVEGYGINAQLTVGSPTIAGAYGFSTNQVGALSTTATQISSGNATSGAGDTVNLNFKASITGSTKAGTYIDTVTLVATSTF
jgi:hypothetical protein